MRYSLVKKITAVLATFITLVAFQGAAVEDSQGVNSAKPIVVSQSKICTEYPFCD